MRQMGKEAEMNRAAKAEPHSGGGKPAHGNPGSEMKAEVKQAQGDGAAKGLRGAVGELASQHPIKHDALGPHHGAEHHKRHMPLHGMKPKGG